MRQDPKSVARWPIRTFRPCDLPKLDLQVDRGTDFKAWKTQWEAYHSLSTQMQQEQVQALKLCFTRETLSIIENLALLLSREVVWWPLILLFSIMSNRGPINESVERCHFRKRKQQHGETFDDSLVSLHELAKTFNFCSNECTQKSIRGQIVEGFLDRDAVEELLKEADLTLQILCLSAGHKRLPNSSVQKSRAPALATQLSKLSAGTSQQGNNNH